MKRGIAMVTIAGLLLCAWPTGIMAATEEKAQAATEVSAQVEQTQAAKEVTKEETLPKLIDYYDQVVAFDDGTPYFGQLVQTEAIADMAGLKCMLKMAEKVDDFDYDKFFRANAILWARTGSKEVMEYYATVDVHPLNYLRSNVSSAQFDEFLETYGIKEGDGMYVAPDDRIAVW